MAGQDAPEPQQGVAAKIRRVFEQPSDTISLYSDYAQVVGTGYEVVVQFYESIPGIPTSGGPPEVVTTRLRATIALSREHAANLGKSLVQFSEADPPTRETK